VRYYFPSLLLTACHISSLYLILKSQIKFPLQILRKRTTYGVNKKYRYVITDLTVMEGKLNGEQMYVIQNLFWEGQRSIDIVYVCMY
jgi:hypothetical protein